MNLLKLLLTNISKHINERIVLLFILILIFAWIFRYDITSGGSGPWVHVLDRWTGEIQYIQRDVISIAKPPPPRDLFKEAGIDPKAPEPQGRDLFKELGIDPNAPMPDTASPAK